MARNTVGRLNFIDCEIYEADLAAGELVQVAAICDKTPYERKSLNSLLISMGEIFTSQAAKTDEAVVIDDLLSHQIYTVMKNLGIRKSSHPITVDLRQLRPALRTVAGLFV